MQESLKKQQDIALILEDFQDILVSQVKKNKNKRVIQNLELVRNKVDIIFSMSPERRNEILLNTDIDYSKYTYYLDSRYSKVFDALLELYRSIFVASIDSKNDSVFEEIRKSFSSLLKQLIYTQKLNRQFIEMYFSTHEKLFLYSLEKDHIAKYGLGYHWFTDNMFNILPKDQYFPFELLPLFTSKQNIYIRKAIDIEIQKGKFDLFNALISWWHQGIAFFDRDTFPIQSLRQFNREQRQDFKNRYSRIEDKETLDHFLEILNTFKSTIVLVDVNEEKNLKKEFLRLERDAYQKAYFFNVLKLIHSVGIFLLYKKQFSCIKILWDFQQPSDATSIYAGGSIKVNMQQLLKIWIDIKREFDDFDGVFGFRMNRSESSFYKPKYDLYVFANLLQSNSNDTNIDITDFDEIQASNLKFYIERELITCAKSEFMAENAEHLNLLGFRDTENLRNKILEKLTMILQLCQDQIDQVVNLSPLDQSKVEEFKSYFFEEWNKQNSIRSIIKHFGKLEIKDEIKKDKLFGISSLMPKDIFNDRTVHGLDLAKGFARDIFRGEDRRILDLLKDRSTTIQNYLLDEKIQNIQDPFLLMIDFPDLITEDPRYKPIWEKDTLESLDIAIFTGWFNFGEKKIPVFQSTGFYLSAPSVFILNKNSFLTMKLFLPSANALNIKNMVSIEIHDLPLEPTYRQQLLHDSTNQYTESYLNSQVWVKIFESLDFETAEEFEGYYIEEI